MRTKGFVRTGAVRGGFTLVELLVVLGILVVLASTVLPRLDGVKVLANKGASASNQADLVRLIQSFRIMKDSFPVDFDTLMDGTGDELWRPATLQDKGLDLQLVGGPGAPSAGPVSGYVQKLTKYKLTDISARNLTRVGITSLRSRSASITGLPRDSYNGASVPVAKDLYVASVNKADDDGANIYRDLYNDPALDPTTITDRELIVVGIGAKSTIADALLVAVPTYSNATDPNRYYDRYLAVFEVRTDTDKRPRLLSVIASDGDRLNEEIGDFKLE